MRKVLEQTLRHPVISFGYPNGYTPAYDAEGDYVLRAVKAAGYWGCRTTMSKQETIASSTNLLVMRSDGFFGNSRERLLLSLLGDEDIAPDELERLKSAIAVAAPDAPSPNIKRPHIKKEGA